MATRQPKRIIPVILSGGSGTRLWPLSRLGRPKQMIALAGEDSLLQQTALRTRRNWKRSAFLPPSSFSSRKRATRLPQSPWRR
jgi:mannose-1-phosphate guanylyltransferase